jgi:branched-chain amino acid transport system ATP-binding protein
VTAPLLSLDKVTKRFGALVVSDAVSLAVAPGRLHALIGPNGAGKTSLINQISGSLFPDSGRIHFAGEDVTRLDLPVRARRGLLRSFQIASILPDFTAVGNVALAVQARSGSSYRLFRNAARETSLNDAAMAALTRVGLQARAGRIAGALAHGEKRLLEIAMAVASAPKLLLLDEPFAGLGREESGAAVELLLQLKQQFTILLVEHDMDAVFALADDISVLVGGRILATGEPEAIRASAAVRTAYLGEQEAA